MRFIAFTITLLLSTPALPGSGSLVGTVDEANNLLRKMNYRKALKTVDKIVAAPDSGPNELKEAYRIKGLSLAALHRKKDAVQAFSKLLAIDPSFRLPKSISPKLRTPFYQAVGMAVDQKPIAVEHKPPEVGERLGGTRLRARLVSDPLQMVQGLRFRYISGGKVKQLAVLVDKPKAVSFKLPDGYQGKVFRYWIEAFNQHGGVLARAGSKAEPFELKPKAVPVATVVTKPDPVAAAVTSPPPDGGDEAGGATWYRSWWFWTVVGVVVVGAVAGGVVGGTSGGDPDPLHWDIRVR